MTKLCLQHESLIYVMFYSLLWTDSQLSKITPTEYIILKKRIELVLKLKSVKMRLKFVKRYEVHMLFHL